MKTVSLNQIQTEPSLYHSVCNQACRFLQEGGLVCLPCGGSYRIVADLTNEAAVSRLMQSKRRTRKAPALVFIAGEDMLSRVTDDVQDDARKLAQRWWPGPLTILFRLHPELPAKVKKQLSRATGKVGVRVPDNPLLRELVSGLGQPLLVSSANKERKQGAGSPAQVRKNFANRIELFFDAGDLPPAQASTVVDVTDDGITVTRPGVISVEQLVIEAG